MEDIYLPCRGYVERFSPDGLQVLVEGFKYDDEDDEDQGDDDDEEEEEEDVRVILTMFGLAMGEVDSMPNSLHDHVHIFREKVRDQCTHCKTLLLKNGEYWFGDHWLWVVEEDVARRLIHISEKCYNIKVNSRYVVFEIRNALIVLDMDRNLEVV